MQPDTGISIHSLTLAENAKHFHGTCPYNKVIGQEQEKEISKTQHKLVQTS